jgi:hypothetical protein
MLNVSIEPRRMTSASVLVFTSRSRPRETNSSPTACVTRCSSSTRVVRLTNAGTSIVRMDGSRKLLRPTRA